MGNVYYLLNMMVRGGVLLGKFNNENTVIAIHNNYILGLDYPTTCMVGYSGVMNHVELVDDLYTDYLYRPRF